ncbi:archease [Candidatus Pacearchaeota archaeon]|nr:archease [Candidatus Pacearchaeota archaeon]
MKKTFKFLEHTADIKFQAFGKSVEKMFENSALGMFNSMYDGKVKEKRRAKIKAKGKDFESLLYNFLEELLVLFDGEGFFLSRVEKMEINEVEFRLEAEVIGDDASNYKMSIDVKAITYHEMFVKQEEGKWICQVVLDV